MIRILKWACDQDTPANLEIAGDSDLVIQQVNGVYTVRAPGLTQLHREAVEPPRRASTWRMECLPPLDSRHQNASVDAEYCADREWGRATRRTPDAGWTPRLGDIADKVGISQIALGRMLDQSGLRSDKKATEETTRLGFAPGRLDSFGGKADWCKERVVAHFTAHFGAEITGEAERLANKRVPALRKREADRRRQTVKLRALGK